jgi:hypothetical protein
VSLRRLRPALAGGAVLALLAGCSPDAAEAPPAEPPPRAAENAPPPPEPQPEPEETRRLREWIQETTRVPGDEARPPPPAEPAPGTYAECMREAARASTPDERALLESGCRPLPGGPEARGARAP